MVDMWIQTLEEDLERCKDLLKRTSERFTFPLELLNAVMDRENCNCGSCRMALDLDCFEEPFESLDEFEDAANPICLLLSAFGQVAFHEGAIALAKGHIG